jgi:uncharacterized protein YdaU (DUF1376 family)
MNYYARHLGDYAKDTKHLSLIEHGAYTLLLDWCYNAEKGVPGDREVVYRLAAAVTKQERAAVDKVVSEFFQPWSDGTLRNKRVEAEILKAKSLGDKNRDNANKRWGKTPTNGMPEGCAGDASALPPQSDGNATRARNQQPVTNTPVTNEVERESGVSIPPVAREVLWAQAQVVGVSPECFEWFWNVQDSRNWLDPRSPAGNPQVIRNPLPLLRNAMTTFRAGAGTPAKAHEKNGAKNGGEVSASVRAITDQKARDGWLRERRELEEQLGAVYATEGAGGVEYQEIQGRLREVERMLGK